ncbi:MAG: tetratricopeptide repeat protein [Candidatus Rokubacteria bacterium]|nr:tetratricopeptide repeat protein [Candidatus Rokubacteria bacterium]
MHFPRMPLGTRGGRGWRLSTCLVLALAAAGVALAAAPAHAQQSEADVLVAQAILAYDDRRYDEALASLREALAQDPGNLEGLYYTGLVLMAQQKPAAAIAPLETARAKAPDDLAVLYQLGVAYFAARQYDRAEDPLTRVFAAEPRTDGVGYYVGFIRYRNGNYQGALEALRAGASADAGIQQLTRFYAGLALAGLGRSAEAATEVEAAVKVLPASPLTGPAERFRDTVLAARERDRRFRAELRAGFTYDSNAPVQPEPSHDPDAEAARRHRRDTVGELFGLRLEYAWLRNGPWEATVSYSFFQTVYNDLPGFNVQDHLGSLAGVYRAAVGPMPYQLGLQYAYDYLTLDDDEFLQRHTATASALLVEDATHLSALQLRLQTKEFSNDSNVLPEEVRDAKNWMAGVLHVLRFAGDRHLVRLGYQFDVEDADGRNFKYQGHRLLAGAQYTLPWGRTRLRYDVDVHYRNYAHAHSILPRVNPATRERVDTEQAHVARVEQPLPAGFTLAVEYQGIVSRSNLPLFSFNRNIFSLIVSWQY